MRAGLSVCLLAGLAAGTFAPVAHGVIVPGRGIAGVRLG